MRATKSVSFYCFYDSCVAKDQAWKAVSLILPFCLFDLLPLTLTLTL